MVDINIEQMFHLKAATLTLKSYFQKLINAENS